MTRIEHYYLRDPNVGEDERERFELDSLRSDVLESWDDSGPAEGFSVPEPRAIGLGTIVFIESGEAFPKLHRTEGDF